MNPRSKKTKSTVFGPDKTIPGQSLKPSELLKRHLAGTLPPIDLSNRYEYHYDERGIQVAEPLPLELHEVHKLSVAIRQRQYEEAIEQRKQKAEKHKEEIISEYIKNNPTHPKTGTKPITGEGEAVL
ncbi:hypothetical protein [robinz microvirus RP_171]|nr:hypothetical protein [robinz microvirus RP_171]